MEKYLKVPKLEVAKSATFSKENKTASPGFQSKLSGTAPLLLFSVLKVMMIFWRYGMFLIMTNSVLHSLPQRKIIFTIRERIYQLFEMTLPETFHTNPLLKCCVDEYDLPRTKVNSSSWDTYCPRRKKSCRF